LSCRLSEDDVGSERTVRFNSIKAPQKLSTLLLYFLINCAHAYSVFSSSWFEDDCVGPPVVMHRLHLGIANYAVFSDLVPKSFRKYSRMVLVGFTTLGPKSAVSPSHSCISYLGDLADVDYYGSTSYDYYNTDVGDAIPVAADGQNYCLLKPVQFLLSNNKRSGDLFGYIEMYVKEGTCSQGITCGLGGLLNVSFSGLCGIDADTSTQLKTSSYLAFKDQGGFGNSTGAKNFTAAFVTVKGITPIDWLSYVPEKDLVPKFENPWEIIGISTLIVGLMFCIATLIVLSYAFGYYAYKYVKKGTPSFYYNAIAQALWFLSNFLLVISNYILINQSNLSNVILTAFVAISRMIATLYSVILIVSTMLKIIGPSTRVRIASYSGVVFLHVLLAGGNYLTWAPYVLSSSDINNVETLTGSSDATIYNFVTTWQGFYNLWVVILFTFILSPPFYLIYKVILKKKGKHCS
jgi:hypothetical protein